MSGIEAVSSDQAHATVDVGDTPSGEVQRLVDIAKVLAFAAVWVALVKGGRVAQEPIP